MELIGVRVGTIPYAVPMLQTVSYILVYNDLGWAERKRGKQKGDKVNPEKVE